MRASSARQADDAALVSEDGQVLTFSQVEKYVSLFSTKLAQQGVSPGDRVLPLVDNQVVRVCLWFSLFRLGASLMLAGIPDNLRKRGIDWDHLVVFQDQFREEANRIVFSQNWTDGEPDAASWSAPGPITFGSSGTTGTPKFMSLDPLALLRRTEHYNEMAGASRGAHFISMPETTAVGQRYVMRAWLAGHGVMGMMKSPQDTLEAAVKIEAKEFILTPLILRDLLDAIEEGAPKPEVERIMIGGAAAETTLLNRAARVFGCTIHLAAGASEAGTYALGAFEPSSHLAGRIGRISSRSDVKIIDESGLTLARGRPGMLSVRPQSEDRVTGYLGGEDAYDSSGWFSSGDIASIDTDGVLTLLGRTNDRINLSGSKYSPSMVEAIAIAAGASQAAAFEMPGHDQMPALGILVASETALDETALANMIKLNLNTLADVVVRQVSTMPRTAAGKLDRTKAKEFLASSMNQKTQEI